jgi:hypothetical protein
MFFATIFNLRAPGGRLGDNIGSKGITGTGVNPGELAADRKNQRGNIALTENGVARKHRKLHDK